MKTPMIMFILVFIFFGVMSSNTDNAMSDLVSDSGYEASQPSAKMTTGTNDSTADPVPNVATMLLVATGLIGLVGVTRRKDA
jgi:hypothetical protein